MFTGTSWIARVALPPRTGLADPLADAVGEPLEVQAASSGEPTAAMAKAPPTPLRNFRRSKLSSDTGYLLS